MEPGLLQSNPSIHFAPFKLAPEKLTAANIVEKWRQMGSDNAIDEPHLQQEGEAMMNRRINIILWIGAIGMLFGDTVLCLFVALGLIWPSCANACSCAWKGPFLTASRDAPLIVLEKTLAGVS